MTDAERRLRDRLANGSDLNPVRGNVQAALDDLEALRKEKQAAKSTWTGADPTKRHAYVQFRHAGYFVSSVCAICGKEPIDEVHHV